MNIDIVSPHSKELIPAGYFNNEIDFIKSLFCLALFHLAN